MPSEQVIHGRGLRDAYDEMDYELVDIHDNLTIPTVTAAWFDYADAPRVMDAHEITEQFEFSDLSFIDVFAQNGTDWYEFSVTAEVWDDDTGEVCNVSVSTSGVSIVREHDPISFETFQRVVTVLEDALETKLVHREEDAAPDPQVSVYCDATGSHPEREMQVRKRPNGSTFRQCPECKMTVRVEYDTEDFEGDG